MWNVRGPRPNSWVVQIGRLILATNTGRQVIWLTDLGFDVTQLEAFNVSRFCLADDYVTDPAMIAEAVEVGFRFINCPLQTPPARLRANAPNMTRIVYDLNTPWMFGQLWLAGAANIIATNTLDRWLNATGPGTLTMDLSVYLAVLVVASAVSAGLIAFLCVAWWTSRRHRL